MLVVKLFINVNVKKWLKIITDVVMETSLLTKEIYRKAHEQKHPRSDIEAMAVAYRSRFNNNMHPKIRENFNTAQAELEMSEQLIDQINSIQKYVLFQYYHNLF